MNNEKFKFEFTIEEANIVLASLGKMPYESVAALVENIQRQAKDQMDAKEAVANTAAS